MEICFPGKASGPSANVMPPGTVTNDDDEDDENNVVDWNVSRNHGGWNDGVEDLNVDVDCTTEVMHESGSNIDNSVTVLYLFPPTYSVPSSVEPLDEG